MEKLNIIKDCYWAMSSGNAYLTDENGELSTLSHSLSNSLNSNAGEYIEIHGSGEISYYGRLEYSNSDLDSIVIWLDEEVEDYTHDLYINNTYIGSLHPAEISSGDVVLALNDGNIIVLDNGSYLGLETVGGAVAFWRQA